MSTGLDKDAEQRIRDRSIRLFKFLEEVEKFRAKRVHNLAAYGSTTPPGSVLWLGGLPTEPEVRSVLDGTLDLAGEIIVSVQRPGRVAAPLLPSELAGRVRDFESSDLDAPPTLGLFEDDGDEDMDRRAIFDGWLAEWRPWAQEVTRLGPVRELYRKLFRLYEQVAQSPEDLETLLAVGCLAWQPTDHAGVQRHLLTMPADLSFDAESGVIEVRIPVTREVELEVDMLDPKRHPRHGLVERLEEDLAELDTSILTREEIDPVLKSLTHGLSDEAVYDGEAIRPATIAGRARVAFAPALVVRKRSNERRLRVLADIIEALEDEQQDVPDGVASIVEPIDLDAGEPPLDPDADLEAAESYLPLAANRAQQEIVWSVEHRRHTVVQGPPGTGKTHTIANVLAHLLATGKRVLITAHTERALKEIRDKLPGDLRDLVIAVTGQGRDEKAALERSVKQMTSFADGYVPAHEHRRIESLEEDLDRLRRSQARIRTELVESRVKDVETTTIGYFHGTPARVAQQLAEHADLYDWLADPEAPEESPLDWHEARELLGLLRRSDLADLAEEIGQPLPDLTPLPSPEQLNDMITQAEEATRAAADAEVHQQHPAYSSLRGLEDDRRRYFATELRAVADDVRMLLSRPESWLGKLLNDLAAGKPGTWERRAEELETTLANCPQLIAQLGTSAVRVPEGHDRDRFHAQAQQLRAHLAEGGNIGKIFKARPVREASELLEEVVVDGVAPTDLDRLDKFDAWCTLSRQLDRADRLWPTTVDIPPEDTFSERYAWHQTELDMLRGVLTTGKRLSDLHDALTQARIPHPPWTEPGEVARLAAVASEPDRQQRRDEAVGRLEEVSRTIEAADAGPLQQQLHTSVVDRDMDTYRHTSRRIAELQAMRIDRDRRDELAERLRSALPQTAEMLVDDPHSKVWDDRIDQLDDACKWRCSRNELRRRLDDDRTDPLLAELETAAHKLRVTVLELTVARAWSHAVERLDTQQRQRLNTYAHLARRLPQGGRYRARKLREVQEALSRCRDAVPAWIMPINYVADVLEVDPEAFDVVIVDEASQAGMDATFLQYLAPKMIVIGDDLQVSPTSFVDRSELHRLADDLLADFEEKALWADPETSLFDHANTRFGKRITLVEHFRCMPEIIGFSQRFIYEPHGVHLVPLRQYGAERLTPIRTHHVPDGYRNGKLNPPEAEALVELVAKCAADPAYEVRRPDRTVRKRTFGVISLTGSDQARHIDKLLLDRIGEQEYAERDIRCGDAADFQGSQREIVFLSLVDAPPEDGSTIRKRGDTGTQQRINVAASRAQDQMWLVHSVLPEHLHPEDIRHNLLTYCLSTERQFGTSQHAVPQRADESVLDDQRFDSLFEQHVFNQIVDRGYAVEPQLEVNGYRIDLVVVGQESKIAVECDGDQWHGPDRYEADIARQRDLERSGWTFFRVRGSKYYADPDEALRPLWDLLDSHGIAPVTQAEPSPPEPLDDQTDADLPANVEEPAASTPAADPGQPPIPSTDQASDWSDAEPQADAGGQPAVPAQDVDTGPDSPPSTANSIQAQEGNARPARSRPKAAADQPATRAESQPLRGWERAFGIAAQIHLPVESHDSGRVLRAEEASSHEPLDGPDDEGPRDRVARLEFVAASPKLQPYRSWDTSHALPGPIEAAPGERQDALLRIVEIEGPILGKRLYQLYVRSSGGTRAGSAIRRTLNQAMYSMEREGVLVGDDPLGETGQLPKTFRTPDQPVFALRELGDRDFHEVPPMELAAMIYTRQRPGDGPEATYRRILAAYDLTQLTSARRKRLDECSALIWDDGI